MLDRFMSLSQASMSYEEFVTFFKSVSPELFSLKHKTADSYKLSPWRHRISDPAGAVVFVYALVGLLLFYEG
jgi:hypothetical protein